MLDVFSSIPLVITGIAAAHDLRTREIPDWTAIALLCGTVMYVALGTKFPVGYHLIGFGVALALAVVVSWGDRFGGGDVKLFAALGAWFGIQGVLPLALWTALAGLPLALIAVARKQKDFAYGPAIFIGVCVHVAVPDLLQRIAG